MPDTTERRVAFRRLHADGFFILPNAWDEGSAVRLQALGFPAIATTSAGVAWARGKKDGELGLAEVLDHLRLVVAATDLPVNADFENGFADEPADVAANVGRAVATGVAGLSVEDGRARRSTAGNWRSSGSVLRVRPSTRLIQRPC